VLAAYTMAVVNELADVRGLLVNDHDKTLPDIGFDVVPYTPGAVWLPDALNQLILAVVALRIFLGPQRKRVACAFMNLHMTLMLMRCLCLPFTTFPAASPACHGKYMARPDHILIVPIKRMLHSGGLSSWCHDLLFSGHAVLFVIAALFLHDAAGELWWRAVGWLTCVAGCLLLVSTRQHYTADVIVAILVSVLVYGRWRPEILELYRVEPGRFD